MEERLLVACAVLVALVGLFLLFLVQPSESEGFRLQGTVLERHGRYVIVATNVTLVAREVREGDSIDLPVFWSGDSFVAVYKTE